MGSLIVVVNMIRECVLSSASHRVYCRASSIAWNVHVIRFVFVA